MDYFSIPVELSATIYIQAPTVQKADAKMQLIVGKQIDALDRRWFSDVPLGSNTLPEVSFASAMSLKWVEPGTNCDIIASERVTELMRANPQARKSRIIPRSRNHFGNGVLPVFQADLTVRAVAIIRAEHKCDARGLIMNKTWIPVFWSDSDNWFTASGFKSRNFPLVLSRTIKIVGVTVGTHLEQTWPEQEANEMPEKGDSLEGIGGGVTREVQIVAERLKTHFERQCDCCAKSTDAELQLLAEIILCYRNIRIAEGVAARSMIGRPETADP
ncbi:hypothetical protein GUK30_10120 [Rhizobium leguminosarum]|uniref:hypothetical protein n=1 Tax=Rhizobium ruizarguesonis TaxID=2081791 RepID=UPI0013BF4BE2|nr:hypothetical protein [Rhizobium ruizarguesonis]NEI19769.1 hypothetical protein [Rhizobium ruizarguesonis]